MTSILSVLVQFINKVTNFFTSIKTAYFQWLSHTRKWLWSVSNNKQTLHLVIYPIFTRTEDLQRSLHRTAASKPRNFLNNIIEVTLSWSVLLHFINKATNLFCTSMKTAHYWQLICFLTSQICGYTLKNKNINLRC